MIYMELKHHVQGRVGIYSAIDRSFNLITLNVVNLEHMSIHSLDVNAAISVIYRSSSYSTELFSTYAHYFTIY